MGSKPNSLQDLLKAPLLRDKGVAVLQEEELYAFITSIICNKNPLKEAFHVLDLGVVEYLMDTWHQAFPNIRPFYAVKCNSEPLLLAALAALGAGFDCASKPEIESVLSLGVSPDRIIFANPCKLESHIKYAASVGVNLTTFDSTYEIEKIREFHPECNLIIRIKVPEDSRAISPLGKKFGALPEEVEPLLRAAEAANLNVIGVSFHIGSGASVLSAYEGAVRAAKAVFDKAAQLGLQRMKVLDLGGGFTAGPLFEEAASVLKPAFLKYFKDEPGLTIMAEPGRFLAEGGFALVANIIGKRVRGEVREYWLNDGVYGSLNHVLSEKALVTAKPLACKSNPDNPTCEGDESYLSYVYGPTCDDLDLIMNKCMLPEMEINDWIVFDKVGSYGTATGSSFCGFNIGGIPVYPAYLFRGDY